MTLWVGPTTLVGGTRRRQRLPSRRPLLRGWPRHVSPAGPPGGPDGLAVPDPLQPPAEASVWIPSRPGLEVRLATQVLDTPLGERLHGRLDIRFRPAPEGRGFHLLESLAWQRVQALLKRHFAIPGCQARLSFQAGDPDCLSVALSRPSTPIGGAPTLEALVARIFLS